ncbi:MAG: MBL fold metallo-hydrolase [Thermoprotei archaeon]|nr:MBL fold metallo-hydrolase [Thermoprotei archaeon]
MSPLRSNCYLLANSGEAVIIDPGWHEGVDEVIRFVEARSLKVKAVLATHGHFDHVSGVSTVKSVFNAPFLIHPADVEIARRAHKSAFRYLGVEPPEIPEPDGGLREDTTIKVGSVELRVMETPGHTPGSVTLIAPGEVLIGDLLLEAARIASLTSPAFKTPVALTGDTLFKGSIGRVDLPGSSLSDMIVSLRKISMLPPETIIYPGHGPQTTLKEELQGNPHLTMLLGKRKGSPK